ncbi:JAB domain-containing protein [uncultured Methanobrevibacter sp.]|uniref:JAB domain-containing protein n=1 Tax=uncultured Methanobrevibacter sp. TaxID=253161 RepID=UPI00262782ED|nr:JAB domain-containing protein [uncultured Methanobrevibacter sp.]
MSIKESSLAYKIFIDTWDLNAIEYQEEFKMLLLNRANKVLGICNLFKGGTAATCVDTKVILSIALKCNAHSVILAHNHPSKQLIASEQDKEMTKKLKAACELLDIHLLDHLIITSHGYKSVEV